MRFTLIIKELKIVQTIKNGYHCTFCDEGISTPNRIIRNLLKKLDANNRHFEYSPDWAGRYRYDAYFEKDGASYVVEMDGGFHYVNAPFNGTDTLEDAQRRDKEKDNKNQIKEETEKSMRKLFRNLNVKDLG